MKSSKMLMNGAVNGGSHAEFRVATLEGTTLDNLFIDRPDVEENKRNIYKAIITRVEPSLEAVFVDYGGNKHGFLPFKEIATPFLKTVPEGSMIALRDRLQEGMELMVQVDKEERGNKGAALTSYISLAGCYLVLMPNNPEAGGISRRIDGEEREELKRALAALDLPENMGVIIRTAGLGKSIEELQWDLKNLLNHWEAIQKAYHAKHPPFLIHRESDIIVRAIRDYLREDIEEILIDNHEVFVSVQQYVQQVRPDFMPRVKLYQSAIPLFSRFGVEAQIASALQHEVRLPSGGVIVIDHTEALVSIDINSSRATRGVDIEETAFNTNLEASGEIARQLRLRDIGGLVVIDFIDMMSSQHQRRVEERLREALSTDRARVQIGRISRFGLLEMSRQRLRTSLGEATQSTCPRCSGHGSIRSVPSIALSILRLIEEAAIKEENSEIRLQVPVDIATFLLNEKRETVQQVEQRHQVKIFIIPNHQLETPHYKIESLTAAERIAQAEASYKMAYQKETALVDNKNRNKLPKEEPAVKEISIGEPHPTSHNVSRPSVIKRLLDKIFNGKPMEDESIKVTEQKTVPIPHHNSPNPRLPLRQNNKPRLRPPGAAPAFRPQEKHPQGELPPVNLTEEGENFAREDVNKRRRHPQRHNRQYRLRNNNHRPVIREEKTSSDDKS